MAEEANRKLEGLDAGQLAVLYVAAESQGNASEAERIMDAVPFGKMGEFGEAIQGFVDATNQDNG